MQYRVVERIAVGGMAEIYRGVARGMQGGERPVVIKKVHPRFNQDQRFIDMLIKEAKITARLNHPNIVQILDLGQGDGGHFIVMEFVDGHDLSAVMIKAAKRNIPLDLDMILYIGSEVCDALDHAHRLADDDGMSLRLIHRDVSPSNVLISRAGEVKLTDFGVARFGRDVSLAGSLKGKLAYMSPEQARAQRIDHRSDLFSVGAVVFEMVLGRRVFLANTDMEMLNAVRWAQIPRPSGVDPGISHELEAILLRALAPVEQRYQTAEELGDALRAFRLSECSARASSSELSALLAELFGPARRLRSQGSQHFTVNPLNPLQTDDPELADRFEDATNPQAPDPAALRMSRGDVLAADDDPEDKDRGLVAVITGVHDHSTPEAGEKADKAKFRATLPYDEPPSTEQRRTERYTPVGVHVDAAVTDSGLDMEGLKATAKALDSEEPPDIPAEATDPEIPANRLGVRAAFSGLGPVLSQRVSSESKNESDATIEEASLPHVAALKQASKDLTGPLPVATEPDNPEFSAPARLGDRLEELVAKRRFIEDNKGPLDDLRSHDQNDSRQGHVVVPHALDEAPQVWTSAAGMTAENFARDRAAVNPVNSADVLTSAPTTGELLNTQPQDEEEPDAQLAGEPTEDLDPPTEPVEPPTKTLRRTGQEVYNMPPDAIPRPLTGIKEGAIKPVPTKVVEPKRPVGRLIALIVIAVVGLSIGLGGAYLLLVGKPRRKPRIVALPNTADARVAADNSVARSADSARVDDAAAVAQPEKPTVDKKPDAGRTPVDQKPVVDKKPVAKNPVVKRPTKKPRKKPRIVKKPRKKPRSRIKTVVVKPGAKAKGQGQIIIRSDPWANIYIDGRKTNKTTSGRPIRVPAGKHRIKLVNPAMKLQKSFTVDVAPGGTIRRFVSLTE